MASAAPPTEFFPGINFNLSFYTAGDSSVSLNYVNNNFLKCTGYAYSRAIATTFNGILYCLGGIDTTTITASGLITSSTGFKGSGTQLTNLNASSVSDGTLAVARGGTGLSTLALGQLLIGNDTGNIVQSSNLIWDITNNNLGIGKNPAQKLDVNGTVSATLFTGSGASLTGFTEGQIPELPKSRITGLDTSLNGIISGTSITSLDAAKLTGTIDNARISLTAAKIPDLDAAKITSGTINNDRISLSYTNLSNPPTNQLWNYIGTETSTKGKYTMDKVGIGGYASDAYDLKLENTMTAKNYCISGSDIFKPIEKTILPERLDMTGVPLDVNKMYEKFNTTNFAIIDNKIDLPPSYSFNITGYDPQTLYLPSDNRRLKGKMSASYDDRNGIYKLVSTDITKTYNTAVLSYKMGDKISFRNTADPSIDYLLFSGFKYYMKTYLYKRPSNLLFDANINDGNTTIIFEWESNEPTSYNVYPKVYDKHTSPQKEYPFTTTMSLIVETGFNYYLLRLFYETSVSGGTIIVNGTFYGDDYNDFNKAYGAGQTFKLLSGYNVTPNDYLPKNYTPPQLPVATLGQLGGVKPRRGMVINTQTGDTDIIPVASDLITSMNTTHFTNNTATNKIDINTGLAELKGPKGDTGKGWTGATYAPSTGIVTFASGDALGFATGDLRGGAGANGKGWTGATYSSTTGVVTFTSTDALGFTTGDLRGAKGLGFKTGSAYNASTGVTSNISFR